MTGLVTLLRADDLDWLVDGLDELLNKLPDLIPLAVRLAKERADETLEEQVEQIARKHDPEALARAEKYLEEEDRYRAQIGKVQSNKGDERQSIADTNRSILQNEELSKAQRLWKLSRVNFAPDQFQVKNISGKWATLSQSLQEEVMTEVTNLLDRVSPTEIPNKSSLPLTILLEAYAFIASVEEAPEEFELTAERINKWLPAVLRSAYSYQASLLKACYESAPAVTEEVVLSTIESQLELGDTFPILVQNLPESLWTDKVVRFIEKEIRSDRSSGGRARLLDFLARRREDRAIDLAISIIGGKTAEEILGMGADGLVIADVQAVAAKALDILIALAPDQGWPTFEAAARLDARRLLGALDCLYVASLRDGLQAEWKNWSAERLVALADLLFKAYPPEDDPPWHGGRVSKDDDYRELRWQILSHLAKAYSATEPRQLEAAKATHPKAKEFLERTQASVAATSLRPGIASGRAGISLDEACRLLDDVNFRVIRDGRDLLEVVVEELKGLEADVGNDLPMFYFPTENLDGRKEKRRREKVFQLYILRRLQDRLPGKVLDRETVIKQERRTDIRVIAPVLESQELAKTVIEVKWSDNGGAKRGVSTGLTKQLGTDYLLEEGLSYGIFLVGWNGTLGTWRQTAGPRPEASPDGLLEALERQRDEFCDEHKGLDIRPMVWNLSPKES